MHTSSRIHGDPAIKLQRMISWTKVLVEVSLWHDATYGKGVKNSYYTSSRDHAYKQQN